MGQQILSIPEDRAIDCMAVPRLTAVAPKFTKPFRAEVCISTLLFRAYYVSRGVVNGPVRSFRQSIV